jgi:hypothetical protein
LRLLSSIPIPEEANPNRQLNRDEQEIYFVSAKSAVLIVIITGIAMITFAAAAEEGIASEGKSLASLTDDQCVAKAAKVLQEEKKAANFKRSIEGDYTVRMVYSDGTVDFACFPGQIVVTVYFSNSDNAHAKKDVNRFLASF